MLLLLLVVVLGSFAFAQLNTNEPQLDRCVGCSRPFAPTAYSEVRVPEAWVFPAIHQQRRKHGVVLQSVIFFTNLSCYNLQCSKSS